LLIRFITHRIKIFKYSAKHVRRQARTVNVTLQVWVEKQKSAENEDTNLAERGRNYGEREILFLHLQVGPTQVDRPEKGFRIQSPKRRVLNKISEGWGERGITGRGRYSVSVFRWVLVRWTDQKKASEFSHRNVVF
jgi:hypothetical protein